MLHPVAFHRTMLAIALAAVPTLVLAQAPEGADGGETASRALPPPVLDRGLTTIPTTSRLPDADPNIVRRSVRDSQDNEPSGRPGYSASSPDGRVVLPGRSEIAPAPPAFGDGHAPYTTARVAVTMRGKGTRRAEDPVTSYPYRATGKLDVRFGNKWFLCSASLVGRSVLITAAHCIFRYGEGSAGWADEVWFAPANYSMDIGAAYGRYGGRALRVPKPFFDGTDTCRDVMCNNDIATVILDPLKGKRAGDVVGWYAYAWSGYGFKRSEFLEHARAGQITQLGYPGAFDRGLQMQRNDALARYTRVGDLQVNQIGGAESGGSSGGPWFVNFGTVPKVDERRASLGHDADMAIIGVTSWGSVPLGYNMQGSSFLGENKEFPKASYGTYGAGNIGKLMKDTCTSDPKAC